MVKQFFVIGAIALALFSCKKDNPQGELYTVDDITGQYIGNTYHHWSWNNPQNPPPNQGSGDTTYIDTVIVSALENGTFIVGISSSDSNMVFTYSDSGYYLYNSAGYRKEVWLNPQIKSIKVEIYNHGSSPNASNVSTLTFNGIKH